jgi:glycosyltransferase involved in cell wall biosynthesis
MRILMLTQWFDPEPTFKGLTFAKELVKLGHEVEVLTGFPNYPGGKLYPGYRVKALQRETVDGISIIRVPLFPSHDGSSMKRMLNYASFAISAALLGPLLVKPADVMYVYHPPATVAFPAVILKLFRRIPFVYDIQDLWPDTLRATGMLNNKFLLKIVDGWCRLTYRIADRIVVLSPGFQAKLQERGVPGKKVDVIYNWCDESQITTMDRSKAEEHEPRMAGRFNVVFAGTMGKAQALDAVLDAAALVAPSMPKVQFVFIGGGIDSERLKRIAEERRLGTVLFLPRRPATEIGSVLSMADVLLVHLKNDRLFEITIPSKTQAYLAAGRPILMAVKGNAAELVEKVGVGLTCTPEDARSLASAVESLARMPKEKREAMGERGKQYYERELSLHIGVQHFERIFKVAIG